ncbi:DUF502 domain-containing protein [Hydrogenophaga sp. BPS33]|uniref:DUF502 domain-containing protein n=1 Tax=Hydrogenophaga sp. BPS33 TaxID=2651974 RepID=UPI00131F6068|nr:DUF502 domain-containing protein [Hydrogenophaga sp. BPS33]QHE88358.1 DUF502 domain-containing protein [Hydrogenophaga sp. BPS33]
MKPIYQTFFRGLITFLPVALTVYVLYLFIVWVETIAMWAIRPLVGDFYLPGLGILVGAALIFGLGVLVSLPVMARMLSWVELPFNNLPVVKSIYSSLKSFADYFAPSKSGEQPQQVVMLKMPDNEMTIVGLVTRQNMRGLPPGLAELDHVGVYLPMGYMIGGYTVFVPRSWVTPIDMTVEEAMRSSLLAWMASKK